VFSTGELDDMSEPGSEHVTASSNKSKWLNFPARGEVIDKGKPGEVRGSSKNQMSHGFVSSLGSSDSVSHLATRLANLGHRI
jgi:hypothetical protein